MASSTNNIYIDALKFAEKKMQTGVSFVQIKEHLVSIGWIIDLSFEQYLRYWFASHFHNIEFETVLYGGNGTGMWQMFHKLTQYDEKPFVMNAKAYETLMNYETLQETRKSAITAKWIAISSILITCVFAIAQILVQIWTSSGPK